MPPLQPPRPARTHTTRSSSSSRIGTATSCSSICSSSCSSNRRPSLISTLSVSRSVAAARAGFPVLPAVAVPAGIVSALLSLLPALNALPAGIVTAPPAGIVKPPTGSSTPAVLARLDTEAPTTLARRGKRESPEHKWRQQSTQAPHDHIRLRLRRRLREPPRRFASVFRLSFYFACLNIT